jgi:hypothetical protein
MIREIYETETKFDAKTDETQHVNLEVSNR